MKKDMPLEGLRWSRDSGSALYDTPPNGRSRTGWGGVLFVNKSLFTNILASEKNADFVWNLWGKIIPLPPRCRNALDVHSSLG